MKKISYYNLALISLLFVTACKKENKPIEEEKIAVASWSEKNTMEFKANCVIILEKEGVSDAKNYCECLLESTMESYPDPELAMELEQHQIVKLFEASKCLDDILLIKLEDPWTEEVEQFFTEHCLQAQKEAGISEEDASDYCSCALEEIKAIIPNPHHVMSLTQEELEQILDKCKP